MLGGDLLDFAATVGGQKYVDTQTIQIVLRDMRNLAQSICPDDVSCITMVIMV